MFLFIFCRILPAAGRVLPAAGCVLSAAGCVLSAAGCVLSKNRPALQPKCSVWFASSALLQRDDECSERDEQPAQQCFRREPFSQKQRSKHKCQYKAEFVDCDDLRHNSRAECFIIE